MRSPSVPADLDDDWCSVAEAARRLGVTPTAVRNRIKRGTLDTKPNGNVGNLVHVPRPPPLTGSDTVALTVPGTVPETDALVQELRGWLAELQGRMAAADMERGTILREAAQERTQAAQERDRLQSALVESGQSLARLAEAREADQARHREELTELQRQLLDLRRQPWWRRIWAA
ncbi:hypothetical protein PUR21_31060 [Methylorubrum rhodesianum]|uniref:Helix-turn-helix domain-containing protein n=1 Tax=Methylorubrum rhodesianum TaxID=29427 RepID=A0ABU9ZLE6_9HYPH